MRLLNEIKLLSLKYKQCHLIVQNEEKIQKTNQIVSDTSNGKTMLLWKWAICGSKESRFIKEQEASGLLSSLGLKTPVSKVPLLGDILF